MDMAFKYVMGIQEFDDDDEAWQSAKSLFVNEGGIPYGAVMYGLFLNLKFANVFTMHPSMHYGENALIENLYIHDLHHQTMEYIRLDRADEYTYQNQFAAPLDARAMLGDQVETGNDDMPWTETQYVGTSLTDALLLINMLSDDWGELGQSLVGASDLLDWTIGEYQWTDDAADREETDAGGLPTDTDSPYLGCNVDRMGHVPKGIHAIRMDGVEKVMFDGLTISGIRESSPLGSELCGEYWDSVTLFRGGGNVFQNTPYYYGYTGNRVHGIFSDWSEYTLKGDISFSDFQCDTGLVIGLGLYTHTEMTWHEHSKYAVSHFVAGAELADTDTDSLSYPYNPAVSNPVHVVWSYEQDDYEKTFVSKMTNRPQSVDLQCVIGVDGTEMDSEFGDYEQDNTACQEKYLAVLERSEAATANMMRSVESSRSTPTHFKILQLSVIGCMVVVALFALWRGCSVKSKILSSTETEPLIWRADQVAH